MLLSFADSWVRRIIAELLPMVHDFYLNLGSGSAQFTQAHRVDDYDPPL